MDDLRIHTRLTIPDDELKEVTSRSGGPGGQHVNKTSTRVTLRWNVRTSAALSEGQRERLLRRLASRLNSRGELLVHASDTRSQSRNRECARERLARIVAEGLATRRKRVATKPSAGSRARRLEAKQRRSDVKRRRRPPRADD